MVRDAKELSPDQAVEAAKERLRQAMQEASSEFSRGIDQTQDRIIETVSSVQQKVEDSASHLGQTAQQTLGDIQDRLSKTTQKPVELVRKRPLEAIAAAALTGVVLGMLTRGGRPKKSRHSWSDKPEMPLDPNRQSASSHHQPSGSSLLSGVLAGSLGKVVWDAVQQEYLTPQNVRSWVRGFLGKKQT